MIDPLEVKSKRHFMAHQKLLLTSSGITNDTIRQTLTKLLGKPIGESSALFIPTAIYAYPVGIAEGWQVMKAQGEMGWKTLGVLELSALPSLPKALWLPQLERADALIVGGGNKFYLSYWMEQSGLFDLLPDLLKQGKTYVGISAGSMMLTAGLYFDHAHFSKTGIYRDTEYDEVMPSSAGRAKTLGIVDFVIRPHMGADYFRQATFEHAEQWAMKTENPLYALDDQSAVTVVDGSVHVVSEGQWKLFDKQPPGG
ncbi:MAG: Type 1 glutamine amidotransferase-like domain-containing protein [Anaerolineae bacterium]